MRPASVLLLALAGSSLFAQTPSFDANGYYIGAAVAAHAKGIEFATGIPGSCDGPILSAAFTAQKVEGQGPLRASINLGTGLFWTRSYLHGGLVVAHDPTLGGQAGVGLWGALLPTPHLYTGLKVQTVWGRRSVNTQLIVSIGWHSL